MATTIKTPPKPIQTFTRREKMDDGTIRKIKDSKIEDGADTTYNTKSVMKISTTPYKAGRKDPNFIPENPSDPSSYPQNENKEKVGMRISAQKAKKPEYDFNGKPEFAGEPERSDTTYENITKPIITKKFKVVSDTSYIPKGESDDPKLNKQKGKPSTKPQERAPGLPGRNMLQR